MRRLFSPSLTLLAVALVLSLTWDVGYRVASMETLLALGTALLLAASLSVLTSTSPALRMMGVGLLFFSFISIYFISSFWLAAALNLAGPVALALFHKRLQPHFFVVFALVFVGAKFWKDAQADVAQAQLPDLSSKSDAQILVHWVMDEMGAFDSVPEPYRVQADIDEITRAYEQRGFHIYSRAASISPDTNEALSSLVHINPGNQGAANSAKLADQNTYKVLNNSLHKHYLDLGWKVSITQSGYLDFCSDSNFSCNTYQIGKSAHAFSDADLPWGQRVQIFQREVLAAFKGESAEAWRRATPALPLTVLNQMELQLQQIKLSRGRHYVFGHFLLPHFPWTLSATCTVKPLTQWQLPYLARINKREGDRGAALQAYWQQTYCTHKRLLQMVDVLDTVFPGKVRFLIHGDHGPRIMRRNLPANGEARLDDQTQRNVLDPFIAARLGTIAEVSPAAPPTLQALVQQLLISEAQVKFYGAAP